MSSGQPTESAGVDDPGEGDPTQRRLAAALAVLAQAAARRTGEARPPAPRAGGPTGPAPLAEPFPRVPNHDPSYDDAELPPARAAVRMHRLAGELHDGAVQELIVAGHDLVELTETVDLPPAAQALLERLAERIDGAYDQLRQMLTDMSREDDPDDPDIPLLDALRACAAGPLVPANTRIAVRGEGDDLVGAARAAAVRVVREGLINVRKHADADRALVTVWRSSRWWKIEVDDDGHGDQHAVRNLLAVRAPDTYGLPSLAADARRAGGRLWVGTAPGLGGLRVSMSLPTDPTTLPVAPPTTSPRRAVRRRRPITP